MPEQTCTWAGWPFGRAISRKQKIACAKPCNPAQSSPEPFAELALIQINRNEFALAETTLQKALKIAPDHYRTNLNLLMLYQRTKDPRAGAQAKRVKELESAGEERERMLLRSLDIRPY